MIISLYFDVAYENYFKRYALNYLNLIFYCYVLFLYVGRFR